MAHKNIITEIKARFCECSICMSEYDERELTPRILPCNHTYCSQCLETLCRNYRLKCPQCNKKHCVMGNDISAFRKDNTIRDLVSFLSSQERRVTCCNCSSIDIKYYCKLCETFLCKTCKGCHINSSSKHHIIPTNKQLSDMPVSESPAFICYEESHEGNELKFFCYSAECRKVLCANCVAVVHRNHDIRNLFEIYEERKKVMQSKLVLLVPKIDITKERINEIKQEIVHLRSKTRSARIINTDDEESNGRIRKLEAESAVLLNFYDNSSECCVIAQQVLDEDIPTFLESENLLVVKLQEFVDFQFETMTTEVREVHSQLFDDESLIRASFRDLKGNQGKSRTIYGKLFSYAEMIKWMYHVVVSLLWWIIQAYRNMFFRQLELDSPMTCQKIFHNVFSIVAITALSTIYILFVIYAREPVFVIYGYENSSDVKFVDSNRNMTICTNKNRRSFSSIPFQDVSQTCKSERLFYKYSGVFANVSFGNVKQRHIDIDIFVKKLKTSWNSYGVILEFGFSSKIIHSKYIYNSKRRTVWGWSLAQVQNKFRFLTRNSSYIDDHMTTEIGNTGRFTRRLRISIFPDSKEITLNDRVTSREIDSISYHTTSPSLWPVFSVFGSPDFLVKIKLLKRGEVALNRESADTDIYVSRDNYTVSNQESLDTMPVSKPTVNHIHYTNKLNCKRRCLYMMKVWFDQSILTENFFEIGLASQYPSDFHLKKYISHISMGTYSRCITNFGTQRHCLKMSNKFHVMGRNWVTIYIVLDIQYSQAILYINEFDFVSAVNYNNGHAQSIYFRIQTKDVIIVHSEETYNYLLFNHVGDALRNYFRDKIEHILSLFSYFSIQRFQNLP